jgi:hypothetical protein
MPGSISAARACGLQRRALGHRTTAPALVLVAWAALLAAWVFGNAPFAAPDEADHYIRTVGVSEAHLLGAPAPHVRIGSDRRQIDWTRQAARSITLPAALLPSRAACDLIDHRSIACSARVSPATRRATALTAVGNYQPLPYLAPAAALSVAGSAVTALHLARAAQAALVLALLAIGVFALHDPDSPLSSMLGVLLAVTPMTLFCGASLSGSGMEIAAAVAFFGCLLRLCRRSANDTRWWAFAAVSGSALALSRDASPIWLLFAVLLAAGLGGRRALGAVSVHGRSARIAFAVLSLSVVLNAAWEALFASRAPLATSHLAAGFYAGVRQWSKALPDLVGNFGYLDVRLPPIVPFTWFALLVALILTALTVATVRERLLLSTALMCVLITPVFLYELVLRSTGFGLQARHVLPMLVTIPLLTGEILHRRRHRLRTVQLRLIGLVVPIGVGAMQLIAWRVNAEHYADGVAYPQSTFGVVRWSPPGGLTAWLALVTCAGLCLSALPFALSRSGRRIPPATGTRRSVR